MNLPADNFRPGYDTENLGDARPDFLLREPEPLILDAKYKPQYRDQPLDKSDIQQMCWYSRHFYVLRHLRLANGDPEKLVILYPYLNLNHESTNAGSISLINRLTALKDRKGENNIPLLQKLAIPVPAQAFAVTR